MDDIKNILSHISKFGMLSRQVEAAGSPVEECDVIITLQRSHSRKHRALVVTDETRQAQLTLTEVKNKVLNEEEKIKEKERSEAAKALFAKNPHASSIQNSHQKHKGNSPKSGRCRHCDKLGH